jgi:hypothetical protein
MKCKGITVDTTVEFQQKNAHWSGPGTSAIIRSSPDNLGVLDGNLVDHFVCIP